MNYMYEPAEHAEGTLILLHGTGGNEHSLIPIAKDISTSMNYVGIRGNIEENGMPRFFRRIAEGVFDMEDLAFRTNELADFIRQLAETHHFSLDTTYLLGYSNGANIASNLMLTKKDIAKGAILLHPMVPSREKNDLSLKGKQIFISAGTKDPLIPNEEVEELYQIMRKKSATIDLYWEENDHRISFTEIEAVKSWIHRKE